jgi:hypothetical protein
MCEGFIVITKLAQRPISKLAPEPQRRQRVCAETKNRYSFWSDKYIVTRKAPTTTSKVYFDFP